MSFFIIRQGIPWAYHRQARDDGTSGEPISRIDRDMAPAPASPTSPLYSLRKICFTPYFAGYSTSRQAMITVRFRYFRARRGA